MKTVKEHYLLNTEDSEYIYLDTYKDIRESNVKATNILGRGIEWVDGPIDMTVSGLPAFQIQYVSPLQGGLDIIEITTLKDGKLYTASYIGKSEAFQKHLESFNKIVSTIKIG